MTRVSMVVWNDFRNDARVLKEACTLGDHGYQVTVHARHVPGLTQKFERLRDGLEVRRIATNPFGLGGTGASAGKGKMSRQSRLATGVKVLARGWAHAGLLVSILRCRPAVVHAHDVNTLPTAWLAAALLRVPLVYDAHEISTGREGYASFRGLVGWLEKRLVPRAAGMITTTDARAKFFARAYGVPRPLVLQNRPRLEVPEQSDRIREALGLSASVPIILYQGGLQQGRGLPGLIQVATKVPAACFVFIGGGRLESDLKQLAETSGVTDRVKFIPTVPLSDLPSYTASADIGVQPIENTCLNHFTTDSNKLFEYVMAGLPVVASRLPEIRRVVERHDLGILVPAGDVDALAGALTRLLGDELLRKHFSARAKQARQQLSWDDQESQLLALYKRVLESRRTGRSGP